LTDAGVRELHRFEYCEGEARTGEGVFARSWDSIRAILREEVILLDPDSMAMSVNIFIHSDKD